MLRRGRGGVSLTGLVLGNPVGGNRGKKQKKLPEIDIK
jgi:hypothetical protein